MEHQTAREIRSRAPSKAVLQASEELAGLTAESLQTV